MEISAKCLRCRSLKFQIQSESIAETVLDQVEIDCVSTEWVSDCSWLRGDTARERGPRREDALEESSGRSARRVVAWNNRSSTSSSSANPRGRSRSSSPHSLSLSFSLFLSRLSKARLHRLNSLVTRLAMGSETLRIASKRAWKRIRITLNCAFEYWYWKSGCWKSWFLLSFW